MNQALLRQIDFIQALINGQLSDQSIKSTLLTQVEGLRNNFLLSLPLCRNTKFGNICMIPNCIYRHIWIQKRILCKSDGLCFDKACEFTHSNRNGINNFNNNNDINNNNNINFNENYNSIKNGNNFNNLNINCNKNINGNNNINFNDNNEYLNNINCNINKNNINNCINNNFNNCINNNFNENNNINSIYNNNNGSENSNLTNINGYNNINQNVKFTVNNKKINNNAIGNINSNIQNYNIANNNNNNINNNAKNNNTFIKNKILNNDDSIFSNCNNNNHNNNNNKNILNASILPFVPRQSGEHRELQANQSQTSKQQQIVPPLSPIIESSQSTSKYDKIQYRNIKMRSASKVLLNNKDAGCNIYTSIIPITPSPP